MKRLATLFSAAVLAAGVSGCNNAPGTPGSSTVRATPADPAPVSVGVTLGGQVDLHPEPPQPEAPHRQRRRMDLDQLDAAIRTVTGGLGWTETRAGREVNLFQDLSSTLGKPDFLTITEEDLSPSAMFQKFLDDASRTVCTQLIEEDPNRETKTFFVEAGPEDRYSEQPERVVQNLQQLLLRFHGRKVAADAPELQPWTWLMRSAEHVTPDQAEVWRTVCVGMMTHPDFYTY